MQRKFHGLAHFLAVFLLISALATITGEASAQAEVKFRAVAVSDEDVAFPICYLMPHCVVRVETILHDPNSTLFVGLVVTICYHESMSLKVGDRVECHGHYFIEWCPLQFCGHIVCSKVTLYPQPIGGTGTAIEAHRLLPWGAATILIVATAVAASANLRRKAKK